MDFIETENLNFCEAVKLLKINDSGFIYRRTWAQQDNTSRYIDLREEILTYIDEIKDVYTQYTASLDDICSNDFVFRE